MHTTTTDFSLHALEARFEMQFQQQEFLADDGGGAYGYGGGSWGNYGSGEGYVGGYQVANDNSGAMLDDGTFTDGSGGGFPAYGNQSLQFPNDPPTTTVSRCTICRC